MRQTKYPPAGSWLAVALACVLSHAAAAAPDFSKAEAVVQKWMDAKYYPGGGLWIVKKDGSTLYDKSWGGVTHDTPLMIASASKWLEAATMMALVDEGRLDLNAPISTYLPALKDSPQGANTLRDLFSHTSTLNHLRIDDRQDSATFPAQLAAAHTDVKPGAIFLYGGLDLATGACAVEAVAHQPWLFTFGEKIARLCRMTNTVTGQNLWTYSGLVGGDLYPRSTGQDYLNFLLMILNDGTFRGQRVLSSSSIAAMQADQVGTATLAQRSYPEQALGARHHGIYGLGEWRLTVDEKGQAMLISSPSFAGFIPWIDKKHGIAGVFIGRAGFAPGFNAFVASGEIPKLVSEALDASTAPQP